METATCTFELDPRGFVHAVMKPGCRMVLADAVANVAATFEVAGRKRTRVLVDARGVHSQSREARLYFNGPEAEATTVALALLIDSPVSRVIVNFFVHVSKQRVPTAVFSNQDAAIAWLLERHP